MDGEGDGSLDLLRVGARRWQSALKWQSRERPDKNWFKLWDGKFVVRE